MVETLAEAVSWYERVLDPEVVATLPEKGTEWWGRIETDDASLTLQERGSLARKVSALSLDVGRRRRSLVRHHHG